ncbi:hypothetical protein ACFQRB_17875 [Halobaculum litoreum]|uniref:Uncharacterized protein n=1 Tax=Halobaculum litoreum TaxID=3031998 RepID=A0ABD5XWD6_9EURY
MQNVRLLAVPVVGIGVVAAVAFLLTALGASGDATARTLNVAGVGAGLVLILVGVAIYRGNGPGSDD